MYEQFKSHATEIEAELGTKVNWREATKDCRFLLLRDGDIKNSDCWNDCFDWFCEMGIKLKSIASKYGN